MPIYEYRCMQCGNKIEVMQRFSDAPLTNCNCGGGLEKLISKSSFHLKGSGWYVTDYARKENTVENKQGAASKPSSSEAKPKGEEGSKPKAENKPESKGKEE
ncbi:MAG: FmdB family zinc ribbon protein [Thermodesulfobacteriota bacterium]|nr:FmdB family zinc ribbon protein [Thermodesulfobacteriota bacterium]